jgi:16S rRNA (cytosine967-C5)-methyltransferase
LDYVIEKASSRKMEQIDRGLQSPLRIGSYEILFLDRVPTYASVNEAVEEASRRTHKRGGAFVNAVLRNITRKPELAQWPIETSDPLERLAIETSHPDLLVSSWMRQFGESKTCELLEINNRPKPLHLLTFRDRGNGPRAKDELAESDVLTSASKLSRLGLIVKQGDPFSSPVFRRGDLYGQDEASQAAALIPRPRPGERILDLAAAPGGKSFSLMASEPTVSVVASDRNLGRLLLLKENCERLSRPIRSLVADGVCPPFDSRFDRVVVDLPCSGTGTLRKHPELKWRIGASEIRRLCSQSRRLLAGAAELPRPGGLLVVITCSLEEEESVGVVKSLIEESGEYDLVALEEMDLGAPPEYTEGPGFWRVLPADKHDGMTVHVLRRQVS